MEETIIGGVPGEGGNCRFVNVVKVGMALHGSEGGNKRSLPSPSILNVNEFGGHAQNPIPSSKSACTAGGGASGAAPSSTAL